MNTTTRITLEDTTEYDFYTVQIQCRSEQAMSSLEDHMAAAGFVSEGCGDGTFEGFTSDKWQWANKKEFEVAAREEIKTWKAANK